MMKKISFLLIMLTIIFASPVKAQLQIALLKYNGGGDWYANPTSLPNLISFCNNNLGTSLEEDYATVEVASSDIFNYPLLHMTGHGNVIFSPQEVKNLREYLVSGGFLHIDDNYGLDKYIRPQMKKVFPELDFVELPYDHPIYHQKYSFPDGLPKVHVHDDQAPQGFGIIYEGRLVCFYTFECDLGDGWEDAAVHKDSEETRLKALRMGANIVGFVFTQ